MKKKIGFSLALLVLCSTISVFAAPEQPTISANTTTPVGDQDVDLTLSEFVSPENELLQITYWQISYVPDFSEIHTTIAYNFDTFPGTEEEMSQFTLENDYLPFELPVYVRGAYEDLAQQVSPWSEPVEIILSRPEGLSLVYSEDFNSTEMGSLPSGWEEFNVNPARPNPPEENQGTSDFFNPILQTWAVLPYDFLLPLPWYPTWADKEANPPEYVETDLPLVEGNLVHSDTANFDSQTTYYEAHLLSPEIDLTGVTVVFVQFNTNYVQNQDNIAVVEYTLDNGSVNMPEVPTHGSSPELPGQPVGSWRPLVYFMDIDDLVFFEGSVDPAATLLLEADGTGFLYEDYVFAKDTVPYESLGEYITGVMNDSRTDGKRFMKFSLPELDNQSSVRFRWMMMGTYSWYFGFDSFEIWGVSETPVSNWALY